MLCELNRHGLLPNGTIHGWPDVLDSLNRRELTEQFHRGIHVPALGMTLVMMHQTHAALRSCAAREAAVKAERLRVGQRDAGFRGVLPSRPCPPFFEAAAQAFDVIIANVLGTGVMFHTPLLQEVVANDTRAVLRVLQSAAAANASKRLLVTANAAQHFSRAMDAPPGAGAYEERDTGVGTHKSCFCEPTAVNASDPRNDLLQATRAAVAPDVRLMDSYRVFQPTWWMHIGRTVAEHPKPNVSRDTPVCDCTHYCYMPEFWSHAYWPALLQALV